MVEAATNSKASWHQALSSEPQWLQVRRRGSQAQLLSSLSMRPTVLGSLTWGLLTAAPGALLAPPT